LPDLAVGLQVLEFFDPITKSFTVSNIRSLPKLNDPYIINLGKFNDSTIDRVKGMGNMVLVTHGNVDDGCPVTDFNDVPWSPPGFGPAGGIQFSSIPEDLFGSHIEGVEYLALEVVARCAVNPIPMPRAIVTVPGAGNVSTWIFTTAGVDIKFVPPVCIYTYASPMMLAGSLFDPTICCRSSSGFPRET
jgi:hypothetical protein